MDLTIAEAALLLERSPRAVRYMIREGRLKAHRIGRILVIRRADLPLSPRNAGQLQAQHQKLRSLVNDVLASPIPPRTPSRDSASRDGASREIASQNDTSQQVAPHEPSSAVRPPDSAPAITGAPGIPGPPPGSGLERPAPRYAVRSLEIFRRTVGLYHALQLVLSAPATHTPPRYDWFLPDFAADKPPRYVWSSLHASRGGHAPAL